MTTILKDGGTVYFRQNGSNIEYSVIQSSWNTASAFPITITNTNPVSGNILTVLFTTDLTLSTASHYFICGSAYITFDGQNNTCVINNVTNYPGLIQNGSGASNGYNYITVQNINSDTLGTSTLVLRGGWIGCSYFGKGANNVLITNCTSTGAITSDNGAGGICGYGTGSYNGSVTVSNCTSSGVINGFYAGGICGGYAGSNRGSAFVSNCYSIGAISGQSAGGICGFFAGSNNGSVSVSNCYSSGETSGLYAGGICGLYAGSYSGSVTVSNCYSSGAISGENAGGICGFLAGSVSGSVSVSNCYSSGIISGSNAGGIYGANPSNTTSTYTYIANGNWSSTVANIQLSGDPSESNPGVIWAYYIVDTPYILTVFYKVTPTITDFSFNTQTYGVAPFTINQPQSNSDGSFSYTSLNENVATITNVNTINIVGVGTSIIRATQDASGNYSQGSIDASLNVIQATPTITDFSFNTQIYGVAPFTITQPQSNSDGSFSYTSLNENVATITNVNTINIVGVGTSIIRATQDASGNYSQGSIDASLNVIQTTPTQVDIENGFQLQVFLQGTIGKGVIMNDIEVDFNLTSSNGFKSLFSDDTTIKITRI